MSENNLKVENSRIPAEEIKNPALVAAIETMQADGSKQNIDAMITECVKAKFILPANVRQIPNAHTENGKTIMGSSTQVQFRLLENNQTKQKFFGVFTDVDELNKVSDTVKASSLIMKNNNGQRSFKVEIASPEGSSYAKDIAEKYGVTYEMLTS